MAISRIYAFKIVIPPTKPPRRFRQLSQPDNVDSSCSPSCSYRRRTPRGSTPRGEGIKNEALDLQGLRSGGDSWTRTNDPFDVNDVLSRTGRFFKLSSNGTRCRKPLKIGLFRRVPFPSPGYTEGYTQGYTDFSCTLRRVPYTNRGTRPVNVENKGFGGCKGTRRIHEIVAARGTRETALGTSSSVPFLFVHFTISHL